MSAPVYFAIPSARPPAEAAKCLSRWRQMGYRLALLVTPEYRDRWKLELTGDYADLIIVREYPGWGPSVNVVAKSLFTTTDAQWIVTGGDDTEPDANHTAEEIAAQCSEHFCKLAWPKHWHWDSKYETPEEALAAGAYAEQKDQALWSAARADAYSTFGVLQPTGDRWGDDAMSRKRWPDAPAMIDRICGSPWLGREFCRRMYGGRGPFFDGYPHSWADEELQCVAQKLGVLWQRRDLIHLHKHPLREPHGTRPDWLKWVDKDYHDVKPLFDERKAAGFPGHEPIA